MRFILLVALLGILAGEDFPSSMGTSPPFDPDSPEYQLTKPKVLQNGKILFYSISEDALLTIKRLENLGYQVDLVSDVLVLAPDTLCSYDLFFVDVPYDPSLDGCFGMIEDYLSRGGAVILTQTDLAGPIELLPPGFEINVVDNRWPEWPQAPGPALIFEDHPITEGITGDQLPGNFETVLVDEIGENWQVLAVDEDHPELVVCLAGEYNTGKLVYFTGNLALNSIAKGSRDFLVNLVNWTKSLGCNPTGAEEEGRRLSILSPFLRPNPTGNELTLSMMVEEDSPVGLKIFDSQGRLLLAMKKVLPKGIQEIRIPLNQGGLALDSRALFLEVKSGGKSWVLPFIYLR